MIFTFSVSLASLVFQKISERRAFSVGSLKASARLTSELWKTSNVELPGITPYFSLFYSPGHNYPLKSLECEIVRVWARINLHSRDYASLPFSACLSQRRRDFLNNSLPQFGQTRIKSQSGLSALRLARSREREVTSGREYVLARTTLFFVIFGTLRDGSKLRWHLEGFPDPLVRFFADPPPYHYVITRVTSSQTADVRFLVDPPPPPVST